MEISNSGNSFLKIAARNRDGDTTALAPKRISFAVCSRSLTNFDESSGHNLRQAAPPSGPAHRLPELVCNTTFGHINQKSVSVTMYGKPNSRAALRKDVSRIACAQCSTSYAFVFRKNWTAKR